MSAEFEMIEDSSEAATGDNTMSIQIQRVPSFMRLNKQNSDDYDPKVVSLGPYHHGKPELKYVEDFKPTALKMFISGSDKDEDFFLGEILKQIDKVRSCYMEDFKNSYNDFDFARMMLLDGCLVLNYIIMPLGHPMFTLLGTAILFAIFRDTTLLENQLPFWILKLLFNLRCGEDRNQLESLDHIALTHCYSTCFDPGVANEKLMETEPAHLLEVFRRVLLNDKKKKLLRPLVTSRFVFRSVMELKSKGIHFRHSGINSLNYASFTSHCSYAELSLPRWHVSEVTRPFFQNLIACEICPKGVDDTDMSVTTYISFMKALITSPNDVRELREKNIVNNCLGSDEEVVQVFRTLNTYGTEGPGLSIFDEIKLKIEEHYSRKSQTWIAELINTYFRSPWAIITLVAATFLLFLSTAQTYYALPFHPSGKGS